MDYKICAVLQDLQPLYSERITSESTNKIIEEHLKTCKACRDFYNMADTDIFVPTNAVSDDVDAIGKKTIKRIKKGQDMTKYFTIILGMSVAAYSMVLGEGLFGIIPFIIIIPFILVFLFNDVLSVLISGALGVLFIASISIDIMWGVIMLPAALIAMGSGILAAIVIKKIKGVIFSE